MKLPGFEAEASLYKSGQAYRGTAQGVSNAAAVVPALSCGFDCFGNFLICNAECGFIDPFCDAGCVIKYALCLSGCSSIGGGGGGGGGSCCPPGSACSCGGRCVSVDGELRCVGGVCLRRGESCQ